MTYERGHRLIDDVASWNELRSAVEGADPETKRGIIARALEDLLATDDEALAEHIHSALFATSLRRQLPIPADWERDDPRFVQHAELWLCVHVPEMDGVRLDRTLKRALGTKWEPMLDVGGGTPEQRYGALLGDLVGRLTRDPQPGTAALLEQIAARAPMLYAYPAKNAAKRATGASAPRCGIDQEVAGSSSEGESDASRPADRGLSPYRRADRSGSSQERPSPAAWAKLVGVLDVGERGVLRALRAHPDPLLDRWAAITERAKRPRAGCYCTQPRPDPDTIRDAPCGMRLVRTLASQPGEEVVLACPHIHIRWIRHEVLEMPDGTYGRHRMVPASIQIRTDPETSVLELAYVVRGWIERPAAVVQRLVETWNRCGRPPAELPSNVDDG